MRIAILGGPGSGKEIQAQRLAERFRVPCISAAALLRQAAAEAAPGAKTAARSRSKSARAPKSAPAAPAAADTADTARVVRLLEERLRARDAKRGFVIDGFPRSIPEAQELDTLLEMFGRPLQIAVCLQVDDGALIKRLTEQLECAACGALYDRRARRKLRQLPAEARARCDACGGPLTATSGHSAKTAAAQIAAYHHDAEPLADYYKAQHKLRTLSGPTEGAAAAIAIAIEDAAADEVQQKIVDLVNLEINPLEVKDLAPAAVEPDEHDGIFIAGGQINRIDPTEDILAARRPGEENAAPAATAKVAAKKPAEKKPSAQTAQKKPAAKKTVKKPAPAKKPAAKKVAAKQTVRQPAGKAAKKPAVKKSTQRAKKPAAKTAAKPAAKKSAKKVTRRPAKKTAKTSGHG